jgi:phage-related holin
MISTTNKTNFSRVSMRIVKPLLLIDDHISILKNFYEIVNLHKIFKIFFKMLQRLCLFLLPIIYAAQFYKIIWKKIIDEIIFTTYYCPNKSFSIFNDNSCLRMHLPHRSVKYC